MKNDGGPAFPVGRRETENGALIEDWSNGISMRDYFAAKAMHAMLNNDIRREEMATVSNVARDAFRMADAMLAEREKNNV